MNSEWVKRRWFEFRQGHNFYLSFFLSFTNFLLIAYNFLIVSALNLGAVSLEMFAAVGAIFYIPFAIWLGHVHNRTQLKTDVTIQADSNPYYKLLFERFDKLEKELKSIRETLASL